MGFPTPSVLGGGCSGRAVLTPRQVGLDHATDQRLQDREQRGVPRGGLPAPEEAEPLPMPAEKRLGLPYSQRLVPVEPLGELRQG